jgi:hypothetical protein
MDRRKWHGWVIYISLFSVLFLLVQSRVGLPVWTVGLLALPVSYVTTIVVRSIIKYAGDSQRKWDGPSRYELFSRWLKRTAPSGERALMLTLAFAAVALLMSSTLGLGVTAIDRSTPDYAAIGSDSNLSALSANLTKPAAQSTDEPIKTVRPEESIGGSYFNRVVVYESGAADIYFKSDHSCYERVALVHEDRGVRSQDTSEAIFVKEMPRFSGPLTVNLDAQVTRSDYPSMKFRLKLLSDSNEYCLAPGEATMTIRLPSRFIG